MPRTVYMAQKSGMNMIIAEDKIHAVLNDAHLTACEKVGLLEIIKKQILEYYGRFL